MQLFSRNKAIVALSLGALALGACGDDVTVPVAPAAPVVLSITPPTALMNVGESVNFAVQISGGSTTSAPTLASCTSSSAAVATATVSGTSCRVTAIAAGNATITAAASTGQSAAASVSVAAPAPAITALAVSPSAAQLAVGSSLTVVPTVNRANASVNVVYTYTSSTAAVATVSATGTVTAVAPGTTTITVTAAGTGTGFAAATMTSAATITVSDRAPGLTSLQVSPTTAALTVGGTQAVTASAQGPRASAATITYGTSAPAIATVSTTGVITAVAAGTATITVTAQSTQDGAFAASSMTGLVTVTVSNPATVNVSLSAITQGPTVTSYTATATSGGISSAPNGQINQPVDITNVRDQIQVTGTLASNGARVDSVVVYLADAAGANRVSAARQAYANGVAASGDLTLFVNTADFTADFTAGTAAVRFPNGQRQISISAWSGTTEIRAAARQTLALNNVDGYAASLVAPRSATSAAGLMWHGGPGAAGRGTATIVPVFYTAGRTVASLTLAMRQGALGDVAACGGRTEVDAAEPFAAAFDSTVFTATATATVPASTTTDGVIECAAYENAENHVVGVLSGTDAAGNTLPMTTYAAGFRASATVTRPTPLRLDYVAPTVTAVNRTRTAPAVTGWVNAAYNFNTLTDVSVDAGVGFPGTTAAAQKAGRTWLWSGCGVLATAPNTFTGSANDLAECASNLTASAYSISYREVDLLGNLATAAAVSVGVDKQSPTVNWSLSATATDRFISTAAGASDVSYTPAFADVGPSGLADTLAVSGYVVRYGESQYDVDHRISQRGCYHLDGTRMGSGLDSAAATSSLACPFVGRRVARLSTVGSLRALPAIAGVVNEGMLVFVQVTDQAGNTSVASSRQAINLRSGANNVPGVTITSVSTPSASSAMAVAYSYTGLRTTSAWTAARYGTTTVLRNPGVTLNATPWSSFTANSGTIKTSATATATTAAASTATTSNAAGPSFVVGIRTSLTSATFSPADSVFVRAYAITSDSTTAAFAVSPDATPTASTTSPGTISVSSTVGSGLNATLTTASNTGANPYSRVDFYRFKVAETPGATTRNYYDYIGSSGAAVASVNASANAVYTFTIGSYTPVDPTGAATRTAATADVIVALFVRDNGGADLSAATTINGAGLSIPVTLPTGATASATITGPNGYSNTVTLVNGTNVVGLTDPGVYTITPVGSVTWNGALYRVAANAASQSVTVIGAAQLFSPANTLVYTLQAMQVSITTAGTLGNVANLTLSQTGYQNVTAQAVGNTTITVNVPATGTWTVTPTDISHSSNGGTVVLAAAAANTGTAVSVGDNPATATVTYALKTGIGYQRWTVTCGTGCPTLNIATGGTPSSLTTGTASGTAFDVRFADATTAVTPVFNTALDANGVRWGPTTAAASATPTNVWAANAAGMATVAVTYATAQVQFDFVNAAGANGGGLAALAGTTIPSIVLTNSANTPVSQTFTGIPVTATGTPLNLNAGGHASNTWAAQTIPSIVLGGNTYAFSVTGTGTAAFGTIRVYTITITKNP